MAAENDPFLSTEDAAAELGVDRATVVRLIRDEELAGKYFGSHLRVRASWLKDWLCTPAPAPIDSHDGSVRRQIRDYEARTKLALVAGAVHVAQIPPPNAEVVILPLSAEHASGNDASSDNQMRGRQILGITFLSIDDIAAELDLSKVVVLGWIRRGEMVAKKIGKYWMSTRLWLTEFTETPDSGPVIDGDENLPIRRARLALVREQRKLEREKKPKAAPKPQADGAPPRKRGRPRKNPPLESGERQT